MRKARSKFSSGLISIDPGLDTGIAIWDGTSVPLVHAISLPNNMRPMDKVTKLKYMMFEFAAFISSYKRPITNAVIEGAALWSGFFYGQNQKKMTVSLIAAKKGHTFSLAYIIGAYATILMMNNIKVKIINTQEWKGNLSKEDTFQKVQAITGVEYCSNHICDAVAIGLSDMGLFSKKHL